jgi:hypothetical protein
MWWKFYNLARISCFLRWFGRAQISSQFLGAFVLCGAVDAILLWI